LEREKRYELVVAGLGGQGVLLATQILVRAGLQKFPHVSWFPSYATFVRGGDCEGTAILSHEQIYSPLIYRPEALIIMSPTSLETFSDRAVPGCLLILDSSLITRWAGAEGVEPVRVPATERAAQMGLSQSANLLLLGVYLRETGALELELVEKTLQNWMIQEKKEKFLSKNLEALRWGYRYTREGV